MFVLYLTGSIPAKPELRDSLRLNMVGALLTPFSQRSAPDGWTWAADNGCFGTQWNEQAWLRWLKDRPEPGGALFATVPDVVADHRGTMERWQRWHRVVSDIGYKAAFVLQDGADMAELPWDDMGALFIGGTTEYKLSADARRIVCHAKSLGKWVHMGRVNSVRRIRIAHEWGCDSVDGTFLAFGPDTNTPKLIQMIKAGTQPQLIGGTL